MSKNKQPQKTKADIEREKLREGVLRGLHRCLLSRIEREQDPLLRITFQSQLDAFEDGTYFGGEEADVLRRISEEFHNQS